MKLLSWNVNGVRAAHRKGFLDWLAEESPDVLGIQEIKAMEEQLPKKLLNPEGYYAYWNSAEKKGYSGVALLSKIEPEKVVTDFGDSILNKEGRVIEAHFEHYILLNVYFPNGKMGDHRLSFKMEFYEAFLQHINSLRSAHKGKAIIFCGDVNTAHKEIDLARPKNNEKISGFLPKERAWIDEVIKEGYIDTFRDYNHNPDEYSWWDLKTRSRDRNVGWRIDYFFIDKKYRNHVSDAFIMQDVMGSDHCPVGIEIDF